MSGITREGQLRGEIPRRLTKRENEVLSLIADGISNREIARKLDLSEGTIKVYVSKLLMKTRRRNRAQLALMWVNREYSNEENEKQGAD